MKCRNRGAKIPRNVGFCPSCGTRAKDEPAGVKLKNTARGTAWIPTEDGTCGGVGLRRPGAGRRANRETPETASLARWTTIILPAAIAGFLRFFLRFLSPNSFKSAAIRVVYPLHNSRGRR